MRKAIYPGTFDPITYGHIDVIKKALKIFDQVVVAISDGNDKNYLFNIEERIEIGNDYLYRVSHFYAFKKNPVKCQEKRHLYKHGNTASSRIYFFSFV